MRGMRELHFVLLLLLVACGQADLLKVPTDYPTIQAAVDAAKDGDTVLVAPGTYTGDGNRDILVLKKAITVRSEGGPRNCIIDCRDSASRMHMGFELLNGYNPTPGMPVVDGFTITGARGMHGGGISCSGGSPRIMNCIIVGNTADTGGGGIRCDACSDVVIANCVVSGNMAPSPGVAAKGVLASGGGICINGPHVTLSNCLITGNRCTGMGGGVACGGYTVVNCTISGNSAPASGGIFGGGSQEHPATIRNSIVCGNTLRDIDCPPLAHLPDAPYPECRIAYSLGGVPSCCKPEGVECPPLEQLFARAGYWDPNGTPDDPNDDFWVQGDYHLKSQAGRWDPLSETWVSDDVTSPGIDAGDPNSPVGAEPFPNGGRVNMGAYGGTAEASKSPSGVHVRYGGGAGEPNGSYLIHPAAQFRAIGANPDDGDGHFAGESANGTADRRQISEGWDYPRLRRQLPGQP
jgi:hypothetical protein